MVTEGNSTPYGPQPAGVNPPDASPPAAEPPAMPVATPPPPVAQVVSEPEQQKSGGVRAGCIAALLALVIGSGAGFLGGVAGAYLIDQTDGSSPEPPKLAVIEGETEEVVAAVAAKAVPTVVNIDVQSEISAMDPGDEGFPEGHPGVPVVGNGSGVAYRQADGGGTYILTNDHVVEDATRIVVTDYRGERYDGEVVGKDPDTDIAVVRIDGTLPVADIGDSDQLVMGQLVVAIGSPFGLQQSVTAGVVSAIGRVLPESTTEENTYPLVDVIQTDAAINPGNSGGALLDREGKLIGINTAIYSRTGANAGIAFAIPVNTAVRVAEEIIETGSAKLPFLGVIGMDVTEALAEEKDLPVDEGAYVVEIAEGTEAEKAGIQPEDVIVSYEGKPVRSMDDLMLYVRQSQVGDRVTIGLWRDGERREVEMNVGVKPEDL